MLALIYATLVAATSRATTTPAHAPAPTSVLNAPPPPPQALRTPPTLNAAHPPPPPPGTGGYLWAVEPDSKDTSQLGTDAPLLLRLLLLHNVCVVRGFYLYCMGEAPLYL